MEYIYITAEMHTSLYLLEDHAKEEDEYEVQSVWDKPCQE